MEEEDKKMVEAEGGKCITLGFDLMVSLCSHQKLMMF